MFDMLATIFILMAAFTFSSKFIVKPKVRIVAFSLYIVACINFIIFGAIVDSVWIIIQQIILIGINTRGIISALREIYNF